MYCSSRNVLNNFLSPSYIFLTHTYIINWRMMSPFWKCRECVSLTTNKVTNDLVITTIKKMGIDNLGASDLERSHRIGQKTDNRDRPHRRTIIVRFRSEAVRDDVYRSRTKLKNHNQHHRDEQVYINEDLTSKRAALAYKARSLKKENKINDCWTYTGRVLVKTNTGMIKEIHSAKDLDMY